MTFKEAMVAALEKNGGDDKRSKAGKAKAALEGKIRFPRLMRAVEQIVTHRYEAATGVKVAAGFDWSQALKWLVENIGPLLKIILPLLLAL